MSSSPRPRSTRQALAGLNYATSTVARPNPVVFAWRWRWEIGALAALGAGVTELGRVAGPAWTAAAAAGVSVLIAVCPPARRLVAARAWCVITAHRVRSGCAQAWIHSRNGKIPVVLRTSATPAGERVLVWCRAGTSADDFSSARTLLAAACWAREVRVTGSGRFAQLVTLDVIRREPHSLPGGRDPRRWPGGRDPRRWPGAAGFPPAPDGQHAEPQPVPDSADIPPPPPRVDLTSGGRG